MHIDKEIAQAGCLLVNAQQRGVARNAVFSLVFVRLLRQDPDGVMRLAGKGQSAAQASEASWLVDEEACITSRRMAKHARGTVVGREGQQCFQVDYARLGAGLDALVTLRAGEERIVA